MEDKEEKEKKQEKKKETVEEVDEEDEEEEERNRGEGLAPQQMDLSLSADDRPTDQSW